MKLDPKKVQFISHITPGIFTRVLRFIGREKTVQLQETALVIEGNLLKVGLIGMELFFQRALAEWSSVTIPYSRIIKVRYIRFPLLRLLAIMLMCLVSILFMVMLVRQFLKPENDDDILGDLSAFFVLLGLLILSIYLFIRIPPRYAIFFRGGDGRLTRLLIQIKGKKLRRKFSAKLNEYREASQKYGTSEEKRERVGLQFGVKAGLFILLLITAVGIGYVGWKFILPELNHLGSASFLSMRQPDPNGLGDSGSLVLPSTAGGSQTSFNFEPLPLNPGMGPRLLPHGKMATSAVWLPGDRLATIAQDNTVRIWDLASGRGIAYTLDPGWSAGLLALTPDQSAPAGVKVAFISGSKGIYLWPVGDTKPPIALPGSEIVCLNGAFDPTGRILTYTSGKNLDAWDVRTRTRIGRSPVPSVLLDRASFSADGKRLTAVDPVTNKVLFWTPGAGSIQEWNGYDAAALTPGGFQLAVRTAGANAVLRILDSRNGKQVREIGPASGNSWLVWAPGGRVVVGGESAGVGFWDAATGRLLGKLGDGTFFGLEGVIDPTGSTIAVVGINDVAVWRIPADVQDAIRGVSAPKQSLEVLPMPRIVP